MYLINPLQVSVFLLLWSLQIAAQVLHTQPPDTSKDRFPPYPAADGDPQPQNWRGTRLFGWDGCTKPDEVQDIIDAYNDMYKISNLAANYANIDWNGDAAKDFFGSASGKSALTDDVKGQIKNILVQVQQMYYTVWTPKSRFGAMWIRIRCSGGDGTGDPDNVCGNSDKCPDGSRPLPAPDSDGEMEAYSDNDGVGGWSQITFCNAFFSKNTLTSAMTRKGRNKANLQEYDNRARVFYHEATHLDYFMNSGPGGASPPTTDVRIKFKEKGIPTTEFAYGAYNARILTKWKKLGSQGYYTQRNADNFAWFALANYVHDQDKEYPYFPRSSAKPSEAPRDRNGGPLVEYTVGADGSPDFDVSNVNEGINRHPGCGDKDPLKSSGTELSLDSVLTPEDRGQDFAAQEQAWMANYYTFNLGSQNLRILPLGDSITFGFKSTDANGYRQTLYNLLSGNKIDMIGTVRAGSMPDNDNEGHNGATIDQISGFAGSALSQKPNVVLLHAGTNDMNGGVDVAGAPARLGNLIDKILAASPNALVLVAQIISSGSASTRDNIIRFNAALPGVVATRQSAGKHVMLVDMFSQLSIDTNFADDLHPNNAGYALMGNAWYRAIAYAHAQLKWLKNPDTGSGNVECKNPQPNWIPQGTIANGAGLGKNRYPRIVCEDYVGDRSGTQCSCRAEGSTGVADIVLKLGGSCTSMGYDLINAVHFADLNGDGRAEYLWVGENGEVTAFLNLGSPIDNGPNAAKVGWLPQGVIATGVGGKRHEIQFADLNGDGRAEYLWVHWDGSVDAWLNLGGPDNGPNAGKVGWLPQGTIATGIGAPGSSIHFADLNGDGRADYLSVDSNGAVTAYLNLGSPIDNGPNAAKVGWLPQGVIATGVQGVRNNTVFADTNGDGRADYLKVTRSGSGAVSLWQNGGGPDNGPNAGKVVWYPRGSITGGDGSSGANVAFADLNGDGRAEYLKVDPDTSAVFAYLNGC